jgi:hypothetical protein
MDDTGSNIAGEPAEMMSEGSGNPATELRKRRSTRIVQAVPLQVTGVDALGRSFVERTSTLIINCHGCRYQSKHYVLKNMWVSLEVPHAESGQPPRSVRGRVAWIQRPRTVRQLFQVALELELPGNAWGIAFPPEDWFAFPDQTEILADGEIGHTPPSQQITHELSLTDEIQVPLGEHESQGGQAASETPHAETEAGDTSASPPDNVRTFPAPASTTDASLQLARQVARLLADAKQQINAAAREAASQAVSAERRLSFEQWEQKFSAARGQIANETADALLKVQQEVDERVHSASEAATAELKREFPRLLAPQLEQLTRDLTAQISSAGAAQIKEISEQISGAAQSVQSVGALAEETIARLRGQADQSLTEISARSEATIGEIEKIAQQREELAAAQNAALSAATIENKESIFSAMGAVQASWREQLAQELQAAQAEWQSALEKAITAAQERSASSLNEGTQRLSTKLREEAEQLAAGIRESAAAATGDTEQQLKALRDSLLEGSRRLEAAVVHASESAEKIENFSERLESAQQNALSRFQSQIDDVQNFHREELHRHSESLLDRINSRIGEQFEESSRRALAQFEEQIKCVVQPQVTQAEETIQRLGGGRSMLDAALTLQQDHIRNAADEAFAESLARFRDSLGSVEQLLSESEQAITARNLTELEAKAGDVKHQTIEELFKTSQWYEKKAQTLIQGYTDKTVEQATNQLREKAGEVSSLFAGELDNSSRNFVSHTQSQLEEVVSESFARARTLFAEAADTTTAAFTDEIQRQARQELTGVGEEIQRNVSEAREQLEAVRTEHSRKVTSEQEDFLRRFQAGMIGAVDAGVADAHQKVQAGLAPLLDSWKAMTEAHRVEARASLGKMSEQSAEQYHTRLENISKQWMLTTVTTLDHQSHEVMAGIAAATEEKLRETCARVFAGIGDTLRERLQQIAASFNPVQPPSQ